MNVIKWAIPLLLLAAITIDAQSVLPSERTLRWVPSLEYTSGGMFDESQIEKYPLYCDGNLVTEILNDFTRSYVVTVEMLGAGDHFCVISEVVDGIESVASNEVAFPLGQRTPGAPTLTVE